MKDKEFLNWIYERLVHVHGEPENVDYMNKLRCIIKMTDPEQVTRNIVTEPWENSIPLCSGVIDINVNPVVEYCEQCGFYHAKKTN